MTFCNSLQQPQQEGKTHTANMTTAEELAATRFTLMWQGTHELCPVAYTDTAWRTCTDLYGCSEGLGSAQVLVSNRPLASYLHTSSAMQGHPM